jgi:hypothetical protein
LLSRSGSIVRPRAGGSGSGVAVLVTHLPSLGQRLGVSCAYVFKFENGRLSFGAYPSEDLILRLAAALDADEGAPPFWHGKCSK